MRFLRNGPNIPDELLEQRDLGSVVFFCGAGVSMPAGLPGFNELARRVMRKLGTAADAPSRMLFEQVGAGPSLDRVFNLLQHEYSREEIDGAVNRILVTPPRVNLSSHKVILRLSRDALKRPQIVTTNFDVLFERAERLRVHVAPSLPDLSHLKFFDGVVYLHGRLATGKKIDGGRRPHLVLDSSDFGRAYLSEGWATRFARELLQTYVIVLLGYSASDPPVRYLLEGLNARDSGANNSRIYAFDQGSGEQVRARWQGLGVQVIPYQATPGDGHASLWDSLTAWGVRADDPDKWHDSIVELARTGPKSLEPYQRGQVAAIARTEKGAFRFAADPAPPAEWLCVFDPLVRRARRRNEKEPDPLSVYGLDDEPPRPDPGDKSERTSASDVVDVIASSGNDERADRFHRLTLLSGGLPRRLAALSDWLSRIVDQPAALWWVGGYKTLHPQLLSAIARACAASTDDPQSVMARAWRIVLESFDRQPRDEFAFYEWQARLKKEGWTQSVLRDFDRVVQPYAQFKRQYPYSVLPPQIGSTPARVNDILDFDIEFPSNGREELVIPSEVLPAVFEIVRRGLQRAMDLLKETDNLYLPTASFHPSDDGEHLSDASQYLHWTRELFDRVATERADLARDEVRRWPSDHTYFFDKLKIYAWTNGGLVPANEVAAGILSLSDEGFWATGHRRELLRALRSRWSGFDDESRRRLAQRILTGRPQRARESDDEEQVSRRRATSVQVLGWLERNGCALPTNAIADLARLRELVPGWTPEWDVHADSGSGVRGGWVSTITDPSALVSAPLSDVLTVAEANTGEDFGRFTRHAPFDGLVEQHPRRALLALARHARKSEPSQFYWRALLNQWPKNAPIRLVRVCAAEIAKMSLQVLRQHTYEVTNWTRDHAAQLAAADSPRAFVLLDRILDAIEAGGPESTESAIGDTSVGGVVQKRSRRTHEYAINSATGHLVDALFNILNDQRREPGATIPVEIRTRLERLLSMPGAGGDYAACEIAHQARWLYTLDQSWVRSSLVPRLDPEHPQAEPAWNGLLSDHELPPSELFRLLKKSFIAVFDRASEWKWSDTPYKQLTSWVVVACYRKSADHRYLTFAVARQLLRRSDDEGRAQAIWLLAQVVGTEDGWASFAKPFLERAWPRERQFRTVTVSQRFAFFAEQAGKHFADAVQVILPFLVPVGSVDLVVHRAVKDSADESLATRFPYAMLQLVDRLMPEKPAFAPYGLDRLLHEVAAAAPPLRGDPRWRRLIQIARGG